MYLTACIRRDICANCFCSCELWAALFQGWVNFTPLLLLSDKPGCATFQAHTCRARKLAIDKIFVQNRDLFLQLETTLFQGWVYFTSLLLRSRNLGCALFEAHAFWARLLVFKETFVQTVFAVANCAVVGLWVLLLGFNVRSDVFTVMIAWS